MPLDESLNQQTSDDGRVSLFDRRRRASRPPEPNAAPRVAARGLKLAHHAEGEGQSAVASYLQGGVALLLHGCINLLGQLQGRRKLARAERVAKLADQGHIQKQGTIQSMAQGFSALITRACREGADASRDRQVQRRLHEYEEL